MYNQQSGSAFGTSQFRGQQQQQKYQPVGMVQSQYGQNQTQYQNQGQAFGQSQQSINSFHTANYRGNQQGHDSYLRSDSQNPSQFGTGSITSSYGIGGQQTNWAGTSQSAQSGWAGTAQSAASFHTANYRGNQPGHDSYLRSDSQNPSSQAGYGFTGMAQSQFQPQYSSFQNQSQTQAQSYTSPQSFHTANYRGNQQGHDSYLRSDSSQPSSTGFSGTGYRF
ncbi:hypothetical protein FE783_27185 [Paenibacillus mesophilus]|uniref:hypothetical protein n=1 Tax=Paenibacillus mesophilus TaxID=2582849 RepID=UPI00110F49E3|nr:hypothetical protein [Paenibacillus mesophilus]TMV46109.1 hypothetical protein FE783_27185 [Paenibacillus mesophilus]